MGFGVGSLLAGLGRTEQGISQDQQLQAQTQVAKDRAASSDIDLSQQRADDALTADRTALKRSSIQNQTNEQNDAIGRFGVTQQLRDAQQKAGLATAQTGALTAQDELNNAPQAIARNNTQREHGWNQQELLGVGEAGAKLANGYTQGALDVVNNYAQTGALAARGYTAGTKFTNVEPMVGDGQNGTVAGQKYVKLTTADGKQMTWDYNHVNQGMQAYLNSMRKIEKVGNSVVQINPDGTAKSLYTEDRYKALPPDANVFDTATGNTKPGLGVGPDSMTALKKQEALDKIDGATTSLVYKNLGASDFAGLSPEAQKKAGVITTRAVEIRRANRAVSSADAANQAQREFEQGRLDATGKTGSQAGPVAAGTSAGGFKLSDYTGGVKQ